MTEYRMPKVNNNDAAYTLLAWLVPDGGKAVGGEPLLEVETSKAIEELAAPADGLLEQLARPGQEYAPGDLIARLHADAGSLEAVRRPAATVAAEAPPVAAPAAAPVTASVAASGDAPAGGPGPVLTAPARALLAELGIPEAEALALGVPLVRRAEVERLAAARTAAAPVGTGLRTADARAAAQALDAQAAPAAQDPPGTTVTPLPRIQRAVAATVTAAHRDIPAAFTAVEVDVTEALAAGPALRAAAGTLVGLPELTLAALAARRGTDPACFAALTADGTATRLVPGAHVGVTFDLGGGLFVPVVHDADRAPLGDLARTLMQYRMTALRGAFRDRELQGANITLTLHTDPGVAFALPVVFPGQACALSLAAPRTVVLPGPDGGFRARSLVHLGAAFDHRLLNGRQVVALLTGVKDLLEAPLRLAGEDE
ncbi:dihydrolipoamide acetyltransferase component of pyruvate dehydrogenase complex [Kitasatospora sp. NE20-6]|uniref:2-oxo acid dehydrogenase subunit E2 n=1 Tax=Kitasatospora sp. NE20-6 TaxID=2859066 RepID=UPI0034DB9DAA